MYAASPLKDFAEFKQVMQNGWMVRNKRFALHGWHNANYTHLVIDCASASRHCVMQYGVLAPKRLAKRAARRNLIKRQARAVCVPHLFQHVEQAYANGVPLAGASMPNQFVIRLVGSYRKADYPSAQSPALKQAVRKDLLHLLHLADKRLYTNHTDTNQIR